MIKILCGTTADEISALISNAPTNTEIYFEPGEYPLDKAIEVYGRIGLTLNGNGAVLRPHFDRSALCGECKSGPFHAEPTSDAEVMHISGCDNLIIRGFTVDSDFPVNSEGRVLDITDSYIEVKMNSAVPFDGSELFVSGLSITEDGINTNKWWVNAEDDPEKRTLMADEIPCTAPMRRPAKTKYMGNQVFQVYPLKIIPNLHIGEKITVQHSYYGLVAFTFRNCCDVLIEDIELCNYGGFGYAILPRCANFTFRRLVLRTKDRLHQHTCINSDGIHVTGLTGFLHIENSYFEFPGDDILNLHGQVMLIKSVIGRTVRIRYEKACGRISPDWARPGDRIRFWDKDTLSMVEMILKSIKPVEIINGIITEVELEFDEDVLATAGDYISNGEYYPELEITGCTFMRPRGRCLVIQSTDKLRVNDCTFVDVSSPAIYMSTAFENWYEAGPVSDAIIESCRFVAFEGDPSRGTAILVRVNSDHPHVSHVHHNITIRNCLFEGNFARQVIVINASDGVRIENNVFTGSSENRIEINNCTDVELRTDGKLTVVYGDINYR